jgi:hypothetical protein
MQATFIHAHCSQQIAAKDTLEFEDKFRAHSICQQNDQIHWR